VRAAPNGALIKSSQGFPGIALPAAIILVLLLHPKRVRFHLVGERAVIVLRIMVGHTLQAAVFVWP
jgi:hypothetical protein